MAVEIYTSVLLGEEGNDIWVPQTKLDIISYVRKRFISLTYYGFFLVVIGSSSIMKTEKKKLLDIMNESPLKIIIMQIYNIIFVVGKGGRGEGFCWSTVR